MRSLCLDFSQHPLQCCDVPLQVRDLFVERNMLIHRVDATFTKVSEPDFQIGEASLDRELQAFIHLIPPQVSAQPYTARLRAWNYNLAFVAAAH
jgi:hypothetical protein